MIPLLVPIMPTTEELIPWLKKIEQAKSYANFGPLVQKLEQELAQRLSEASHAPVAVVTCKSGTSAIKLALKYLNLREHSKVLTPALTFVGTGEAIVLAGHEPIFSDVDPTTWILTPEIAAAALSVNPDIAAIVPVAAYGYPHAVEAWDTFSEKYHIPVILDAAGAFGHQPVGKKTIVTYSFHATKSLSTGEGGLIASQDKKFIEQYAKPLTLFRSRAG